MNRIDKKLEEEGKLLSIYFTAGYPNLNDTKDIIIRLQESGVDMIEIGLPFSDPLADGPTIQDSSTIAIKNGMNTNILFDQLKGIRDEVSIPLIIMGYFNPMLQYGVEAFCKKCNEIGIDGLIIPDLPIDKIQKKLEKGKKKLLSEKEIKILEEKLALEIVKEFLQTDFEAGRHSLRVDKI